mgnify:CR=1 FL=1
MQRGPDNKRSLWLAVALVGALAGAAAAAPAADPAQDAFSAIARAWLVEDHAALANLIAPDGAEIALGPRPGARRYSASQAFYFFKTLFRSTDTDAFRFSLQRSESDAALAHAVADWSYRRAGQEGARVERLVFTLARGETGWGLTDIHAIR